MADMPISRPAGTGPIRPPAGSGPLPAGSAPPGGPNAGGNAAKPAGPTPARDSLDLLSDLGNLGAKGARALTAFVDPDAIQGLTDGAQSLVDVVSGAADTSAGLTEAARNAARPALNFAERVADTMGEGTKLGNGMMITGGALGVVGGAAQTWGGANKLMDGDASNNLEGGMELAQGALRMGEGGGMIFATAAANSARFAGAATAVGGRVVPILGAGAGVVQFTNALMKDPADVTSATTGAMTAIGSAAMLFPPVGTAVGGVMVATAAVIDNWDTITDVAGKAADAVGGAADAVGDAVGGAAKTVASWFGW